MPGVQQAAAGICPVWHGVTASGNPAVRMNAPRSSGSSAHEHSSGSPRGPGRAGGGRAVMVRPRSCVVVPGMTHERAVRMVAEVRPEYPSDWPAIRAVAGKLGIASAEMLRN